MLLAFALGYGVSAAQFVATAAPLPTPSDLRVEYLPNPQSIGIADPRFSFAVNCAAGLGGTAAAAAAACPRGTAVSAHRIVVTERATGAVAWDSGARPAASGSTSQIVYGGTALKPDTDYLWAAAWAAAADAATFSAFANATFSTALLGEADWQGAEWLGTAEQRQLRRALVVPAGRTVARARAYIAAPGCVRLLVNGKPAGDQMGVCPWTQFGKTVLYQTYDLGTPGLLRGASGGASGDGDGSIAIELLLGLGMWGHDGAKNPAVRFLLTATLDDGTALVARSAASPAAPTPPPAPTPPTPAVACGDVAEHGALRIGCDGAAAGQVITAIDFVSFGQPSGSCSGGGGGGGGANTFVANPACDAKAARALVESSCLQQSGCTLRPKCQEKECALTDRSKAETVPDPCWDQPKHLAVAVTCGAPTPAPPTPPPPPTPRTPGPTPADRTWTAARGPYVSDDPFVGTHTDWAVATDPSGAQVWAPAVGAAEVPGGKLGSLMMPLSRQLRTLAPVAATALANGHVRFDFAENFVGVARIDAAALAKAFGLKEEDGGSGSGGRQARGGRGQGAPVANITIQHCEKYNRTTGEVICDLGNGKIRQQDNHTNAAYGAGAPPLVPAFTWHGFQYAEVAVAGGAATAASVAALDFRAAVQGLEIRTDLEQTGSVSFGAAGGGGADADATLLNRIQTLVSNSQKANVAAYQPTDCPTREKHGWLGDAQVTAEEAMLNFGMAPIYTFFLQTIRDSQQGAGSQRAGDVAGVVPVPNLKVAAAAGGAAAGDQLGAGPDGITDISWSAAYPLIARWMLKFYGDLRVVADHYDNLAAFMDDLLAHAPVNGTTGGLPDFFTWGDWCAVESRALATPGTGPELAAFNFILSADAMADMAVALGKAADAARYAKMSASLRAVFHARFYNASIAAYGTRELELQSLVAAPLALGRGTIPAALEAGVLASLHADVATTQKHHLTVGSVGAKHLLPQLSAHGLHDDAMAIATQTSYPSFGWWLAQGATTCWENYSGEADASHPPAPTRNHIFLCGGVGEWMYRSVAGVGPAADGYKRVFVAPKLTAGGGSGSGSGSGGGGAAPKGPGAAAASLRTVSGTVSVSWARHPAGNAAAALELNTTIPPAVAGADVTVPAAQLGIGAAALEIREGGALVWAKGAFVEGVDGVVSATAAAGGDVTFEALSGSYSFTVAPAAGH